MSNFAKLAKSKAAGGYVQSFRKPEIAFDERARVEEAMNEEAERAADRARYEKEASEQAARSVSTTTLVDGPAKKRKRDDSQSVSNGKAAAAPKKAAKKTLDRSNFILPPISLRNERTPGGEQKHQSSIFECTYDNAYALYEIIGSFGSTKGTVKYFPCTFTKQRGLEAVFMDEQRVMGTHFHVPRQSFLQYKEETLLRPLVVTLSAATIASRKSGCKAGYSITFLNEQFDSAPDSGEKMHTVLAPVKADMKDAKIVRSTLNQYDCDDAFEVPDDVEYSYRIHVKPKYFVDAVTELSKEAVKLSLTVTDTTVELGSIVDGATECDLQIFKAKHVNEGDVTAEAIEETLENGMFLVEKLKSKSGRTPSFKAIGAFRASAKYMISASAAGNFSHISSLVLEIGMFDETCLCPLKLHYTGRVDPDDETGLGRYTLTHYLAPLETD